MRTSHISKLSFAVAGIFLFAIFTTTASPARGSCRIKNISLKKEGKFTEVSVYADKHFEFSHFTEEAKGGKPYRVVIDCRDAIFDLPRNNYRAELPPGSITAIRTSQYQVDPERIVRVVLDLKGPLVYKVTNPETENEASIAILTTQDPDFSMWVAVLEKGEEKLSLKEAEAKAIQAATASPQDLKSDQSKTSLKKVKKPVEPKASKGDKVETLQKGKTYSRAVCYADTGEVLTSAENKEKLSSQAKSGTEVMTIKESSKKQDQSPQSAGNTGKAAISTGKDKTILPEEQKPALSSKSKSEMEGTKTKVSIDKTQKEKFSVSTEFTSQSVTKTKAQKEKTPSTTVSGSEKNISKELSSREQTSPSTAAWGPLPLEQSSPTQGVETRKAEVKKEVPGDIAGPIEKGIGAILGPEPAAAKETRSMVDSSTLIQNLPEAELGLTPQRKVVHYNPETKRDIFVPLTKREEMNFGETPQPLFENLRLVGILKDEEGNRALLEDEMGFGYILMSGDEIKNGYVVAVEDNRAVFHVEEYGGYQIMVLELNREY
jgi:hypothetical protein